MLLSQLQADHIFHNQWIMYLSMSLDIAADIVVALYMVFLLRQCQPVDCSYQR